MKNRSRGSVVDIGKTMEEELGDLRRYAVAVDVGIVNDPELAAIGRINEYGDGKHIPSRPFMRITNARTRLLQVRMLREAVDAVQAGVPATAAIKPVAIRMVQEVKRTIIGFRDPPNADSTVEKKGFDNPLQEHGDLVDAITYRIDGVR